MKQDPGAVKSSFSFLPLLPELPWNPYLHFGQGRKSCQEIFGKSCDLISLCLGKGMQVPSLFSSNFCCRLGRWTRGDWGRDWEEDLGQGREQGICLQASVETAEEWVQCVQKLNLFCLLHFLCNQTELCKSMCNLECLINQNNSQLCFSNLSQLNSAPSVFKS